MQTGYGFAEFVGERTGDYEFTPLRTVSGLEDYTLGTRRIIGGNFFRTLARRKAL